MKPSKKQLGIIAILSVLIIGTLFMLQPNYWLKIVAPLKYNILLVEIQIENDKLFLNLEVVIENDYFLPLILDSIEYHIKMDAELFSKGKKVFEGSYNFNGEDTISLPLEIDIKTIKSIIKSNQIQDSILLEIDFTNYLQLPYAGTTILTIPIKKMIPTPNPPKFKVTSVEKKLIQLHDAKFVLHFEIENPNVYEINVQRAIAHIDFPDLFSGHINNNKGFLVAPYSTIKSSADIDIDDLELVRDGLRLIFKPKKDWEYNLDLQLTILKKDRTEMELQIYNNGVMPLKKNR